MSNSESSSEYNIFMFGWLVGMVTCLIVTLWSLSGETVIKSNKIIIPEKQLTTDGKIIDTIYVYKQ